MARVALFQVQELSLSQDTNSMYELEESPLGHVKPITQSSLLIAGSVKALWIRRLLHQKTKLRFTRGSEGTRIVGEG